MALLEKHFSITEARDCPLYRRGERFSLEGVAFTPPARKPVCLFLARTISTLLLEELDRPGSEAAATSRHFNCPGCTGIIKFTYEGSRPYATPHMQMLAMAQRRRRGEQLGPLMGQLASFSFFRALDEASLKDIISCTVMRQFAAGTTILRRNQPGRALYIILEGRVSLHNKAGHTFAQLGPGEIFGEMSLLTGNPVSATVVAADAVKLLTLAEKDFRDILVKYPFLQAAFIRLLVTRLAATTEQQDGAPPAPSPSAEGGMKGSLAVVSPAELFQMFHENLKTGEINLHLAGGDGQVVFVDGEIVAARYAGLQGVQAFDAILRQDQGTFTFRGEIPAHLHGAPPLGGFMKMLMDGLRRLDEAAG